MAIQNEWLEKDYYAILGVPENASAKDITRAYRKLAKAHHPDATSGDDARFKEISAAYDVIGDDGKRKEYDEARRLAAAGGPGFSGFGTQGGGFGAGSFNASDFSDFDLSDLFGGMFTNTYASRGPRRGADFEAVLQLTFREAVKGVTKELVLSDEKPTKVRIPAGVQDGQRIRIKGRGGPGDPGAEPGDLYVICRVPPDAHFSREDNNLVTKSTISFPDAALGTTIKVPTLDEPVTLRVPAGTQPGTKLRIKGKGVPGHGRRKAGDLLVRVEVSVPKSLNDEQRAALNAFKSAMDGSI